MAEERRPAPKPAAFWGPIQAAVRQRATTAEIWDAIRGYAADQNVPLPAGLFGEVNRMRSLAAGLRISSERLASARPDDAITSRMVGTQLYARNALERALGPAYHIRFELSTTGPDGPSIGWYTVEYSGGVPATVGQLMAELEQYAEGLADSYGVAVGEIGAVELGEF